MQPYHVQPVTELSEEERACIADQFYEEIVPKLKKMHARIGTLSCAFAGEAFETWMILFREAGEGFDIVDFEYDPDARSLNLDL